MTTQETKQWFTVQEALRKIGISSPTLYDWMREFGIQKHKFRRDRRTYLAARDVQRLAQIKAHPELRGEKVE